MGPDTYREGVQRAYDLWRQKQTAAALDAVRALRAHNPGSTYLTAVEADILARSGKTREAEDLLAEIFALDPHNRKALTVKADLLLKKGRAAEALATLLTHPDQAAPHVARRLATAHFQLKQYNDALAVVQKVLGEPKTDLPPLDAAWFKEMAAGCLERLDKTREALSTWETLGTSRARIRALGLKLAALTDEEALRELEQIGRLKSYDRDADFHALWAERLAAGGRHAEAAFHWERASALAPGHPYYLKRLAWASRRANAPQTLARFQDAVSADPDDLLLREALFRLFAAGRELDGISFLTELLRRHPGAGWAHGHLKKLTARQEMKNRADK